MNRRHLSAFSMRECRRDPASRRTTRAQIHSGAPLAQTQPAEPQPMHGSGLVPQRHNVFRQTLIAAVHEVVFHAFRESAGLGYPPHCFSDLTNVHWGGPTTYAEVVNTQSVGVLSELSDFIPVGVQRIECSGESPTMW